jgi:intein/homing endonuclease
MTEQEKAFVASIQNKIKKYQIKTDIKSCFRHASGVILNTTYASKKTEVVDSGIESFLMSSSFAYWLDNYAMCDVPNKGTVKFDPYFYQLEMAKEIGKYRKIVIDKTRQCLTRNNFVNTNRGLISIADVKIGDKIETIQNGKIVYTDVLDFIPQGKKTVARVMTKSGLCVEGTLDHKVLTKEGWKEIKDLSLKDEVVSGSSLKPFGNFKLQNDKLAAFIGYYLADGKYNAPVFVNTNLEYINETVEAAELFENCEPWIYYRKQRKNRLQAYDARFVSKGNRSLKIDRPIKNFLHNFGLDVKSVDRCLTTDLMNLKRNQMSILINRLYAGDGWITHNQDKRRPHYISYEIGFGSPCFKLVKQLEYILQMQYGIYCWVQLSSMNGKDFWKLRITQKKSVMKFVDEIGIKGKTDTEEYKNLFALERPCNTKQSCEKITKISLLEEEQEVFDITTGSHDFLANGLVVHNCGMSTVFSLYCLWRLLSKPSENIDVISLTQAKSIEFVKKFKTTIEIQPPFFMKEIVENNKQKMRFRHPNGEISTITSESQTENAGRADSLSLLILDELAFYKSDRMVQSIISAAIPTLTRTSGSQIYISTPNGTVGSGSYYYNQVQEAKMGLDPDTKYLQIGWWEIPDDNNMHGPKRGYNKQLAQAIQEDYYHNPAIRKKWNDYFEPIGKDPNSNPFLKSQFGSLGEFKYRQEILHEFIISGDRVLTPGTMTKIKSRLKDPIVKDYLCLNGKPVKEMRNYWVWKHPEPKGKYIVALDPSQGTSQDRACIQVLDVENMEQCAEFYGFAATTQLPNMVKDIARVYNDAYVVIEANSIGDGVFNALYYNQNDPYGNVFKQKKSSNGITRFTGWITDVKTRKLMTTEIYDWLSNAEMFDRLHLYSERVYTELETWIVDSKGKFIHASSCHDDSIMSFSLALYNRNKAVVAGGNSLGFVDEDGNTISYDRNSFEKNLQEKKLDGVALSASQHENELSSILDDGRRKLNLRDTNYAGMYGNQDDFAAGGGASIDRTVQEQLGVSGLDVYNWLLS